MYQQGNRRYQTSPAVCNSVADFAADTSRILYFLNLSPINAKLTSLSYVHASKSLVYLFLRQRSPLP